MTALFDGLDRRETLDRSRQNNQGAGLKHQERHGRNCGRKGIERSRPVPLVERFHVGSGILMLRDKNQEAVRVNGALVVFMLRLLVVSASHRDVDMLERRQEERQQKRKASRKRSKASH